MENEMEPDGKNTFNYANEDILEAKFKRRSIRLQNLQNTELPESSTKLPRTSTNDLKQNNANSLELYKEYDEINVTNSNPITNSDNIQQSSDSLKIIKNVNDTKYFKRNSNIKANSSACDIQTENVSNIRLKSTSGDQSSELKSAVQPKSPIKTYINPRKFSEKKPPIETFALPDNPLSCQNSDIGLSEIDKVLDTEILDAKEITIQELQFVDEPWCIIDLEKHFSKINEIRIKAEPQKHFKLCHPAQYKSSNNSEPKTILNKPVRRLLDIENGPIEKQLKKLHFGKSKNERIIANHSLTLEEHEVEIFNSGTVQNVSDSTGIKTNRQNQDIDKPDSGFSQNRPSSSYGTSRDESQIKNKRHSIDLGNEVDLEKSNKSKNLKKSNLVDSEFCVKRHLRSSGAGKEDIYEKQTKENFKIKNCGQSTDLGKTEVDFDIPTRILRSNSCTDLDNFEKCRDIGKLKKSYSQINLVSDNCSKIEDVDVKKSNDKINSVIIENRELKSKIKQLKVTLYQLPVKSKANKQTDTSRRSRRGKNQISNKKLPNLTDKNSTASCGMILELVNIQRDYTDSSSKSTSQDDTYSASEDEIRTLCDNFSFKRKSKSAANARLTQYFQNIQQRKYHTIDFFPFDISSTDSQSKNVLNEISDDISLPNGTSTPNKRNRGRPRKMRQGDSDTDKSLDEPSIGDSGEEENCTKEENTVENVKILDDSTKRKRGRPRKLLKVETTETDLSVSADSSIEEPNDAPGNNESINEVKENNRLLRSRPIKLNDQSKDETNPAENSKEIDVVENGNNKRHKRASIEDNNKTILQCFQIDAKDPVDETYVGLIEIQKNSQNLENLLDIADEEISAINGFRPSLNKAKRSNARMASKINGHTTDFISETNPQLSDYLNTNKETSPQKMTRSKTSLGDKINDDFCQKRTRSKTSLGQRANGIKDGLIDEVVDTIQSPIDESVSPRKSKHRTSLIGRDDDDDNNRSTKTKLNGSGNIDLNKITIDDEIEFENNPDKYSGLTRSIDRRFSRSGDEDMSTEYGNDISSRITRSKSSMGLKIEIDNTDDSPKIRREKSNVIKKNGMETTGNNVKNKHIEDTLKVDIVEETLNANISKPIEIEIFDASKSRVSLEGKLDKDEKDEAKINSDNINETEENDISIPNIEKHKEYSLKAIPSRITRSKNSLDKRINKNDNNSSIDNIIDYSSIVPRKNSLTNEESDNAVIQTPIELELDDTSCNKDILDEGKDISVRSDENFDTNVNTDNLKLVASESTDTDDKIANKISDDIIDSSEKTTIRNSLSDDEPFSLQLGNSLTISNDDVQKENCKSQGSLEKNSVERKIVSLESKSEYNIAEQTITAAIAKEIQTEDLVASETNSLTKEHLDNVEEAALINDEDNDKEDAVVDQIHISVTKPKVNDSVEDSRSHHFETTRRSCRRQSLKLTDTNVENVENVVIDSKNSLEEIKSTAKIDYNKSLDGIKSRTSLDGKLESITANVEDKRPRGRTRSKSVASTYRYSGNKDDDVQKPTSRKSDEAGTTQKLNHRDRRSSSVGPKKHILKKMLNDYKKYAIPIIAKPKLGEIAWAQIGNYPYWPCVITNDPTSKSFTKSVLHKYIPNKFYHVRFFGDRGKRAWISSKKIMKFTDRDDLKTMRENLKEVKFVSELQAFTIRKFLMNKWLKAVEEVEYVKSQKYNLKQIIEFMETVNVQSQDAQDEHSETNISTKSKKNKTQDDSPINEKDTSTEDIHVKKKIKLSLKSSPSTSQRDKSPKKKISKALEDEPLIDPTINQDPIDEEPVKIEDVIIKDEISDIEYKVSVDSIQHFGNYSLDDQRSLYKRNHLFKGVPKDKVCQFCLNFGDLYYCKGGCQGIYHLKCSRQVLIEKIPKWRKMRSPKTERSIEVKKVEKQEHSSSGNQSEVDESHVQIITVASSVCATPPKKTFPPDVMNMTLADRIDFKMKEIMKKFESKTYMEMLNESTSDEKPTKSPLLRNRSFSMCQDLFSVGDQKSPQRCILFNKELNSMAKINQQSPISAKQIEESLEMILQPPNTKHVTADSPGESPNSSRQTIKDKNATSTGRGEVIADTKVSANVSNAKDRSKNKKRSRKSLMKHVTADFPSPPDKTPSRVSAETKKPNGARKSVLKHVTADADSVETVDSESLRSNSSRQSKQSEISENVDISYRNINPKHFKCGFCTEDIDPYCFICHDSVSRSGSNIRQKCSLYRCPRFYHPECLKLWPQAQWSLIQTTKNRFSQEEVDSFVCPQHVCHTCASDDPRAAISRCSGDKIVKCLSCPASYHSTNLCVPAGTEIITTTQVVCPRHRNKNVKNHTINTTWCFICNEGGNLICCEICPTSVHPECMTVNLTDDDKFICEDCESGRLPLYDEIVWVKVGQYKWWPGLILFPNEVPPNVFNAKHSSGEFVVKFFGTYDHFWVNRGRSFLFQEGDTVDTGSNTKNKVETVFKKAVEEAVVAHKMKKQFKSTQAAETASLLKPPPYIKIKASKPVGNVKLMELNLSNTTACECDPAQPNPCGPDSNCLNRLLWTECNPEVCPAGELCKNQSFEKREYPPLVPYKTETRGWGLKSLEPIKKGTFVIEYVGELIDDEEYQRRVMKMHEQKEENYYFLTIHTNRMIDAGPKGNVARFMNHCCQPNCETQKWTVNGETRVGLFATEDIPAHAELTFNYNLECTGTEKKVCKCGASNCSGFIGVKAKQESAEPKKPKKLKKKEPVKAIILPPCFICQKKGDVGLCNNKICNKAYHLGCLKLDEWPEGKKYVCQWHYCNICSKRTIRCCVKCLNSFCPSHSEGNVRYDNLMGFVCNIHDPSNPNSISSVKKKRSTVTSEEAVVTSTTSDIEGSDEDDASLTTRSKLKKSKKHSSADRTNIDANFSSIEQSDDESQDETVSSATASDFEDELLPKRKRKAKRKMKCNRIKIMKSSKNVHQMNTANSNNSLNSSNISR